MTWNHNDHYTAWVLQQLPRPCGRVLDVGCGEGDLARALAARADTVVAVDVDEPTLERARVVLADVPNVEVRRADLRDADGEYDAVTAVAVLHHLDLAAALRHVARLVRPGGVVAVVGCFDDRSKYDMAWSLLALPFHRRRIGRLGEKPIQAPGMHPTMTMGEVRRVVRATLPGAKVRRRLYWRYTLVWRKPS